MLNRVLGWTSAGLECEADPRQCEGFLEGLGLDDSFNRSATLGIKPLSTQLDNEETLSTVEPSNFRALAARANYVAADRVDVQYIR